MKKILAIIFLLAAVANFILLILQKMPTLYFWINMAVIAIFAFYILPKMKA